MPGRSMFPAAQVSSMTVFNGLPMGTARPIGWSQRCLGAVGTGALGQSWRNFAMPGSQLGRLPCTWYPQTPLLDALPGVLIRSNAQTRGTAALAFAGHIGACDWWRLSGRWGPRRL